MPYARAANSPTSKKVTHAPCPVVKQITNRNLVYTTFVSSLSGAFGCILHDCIAYMKYHDRRDDSAEMRRKEQIIDFERIAD